MNRRIDECLVAWGLARSRHQAQEAIELGLVSFQGKVVSKSSQKVDEDSKNLAQVQDHPLFRFVSRGGVKLAYACEDLRLSLKSIDVLDIGISTGGFSDYCLQSGARWVIGVDVGHGQLSSELGAHKNLICFEKINAGGADFASNLKSKINEEEIGRGDKLPADFDVIVTDVSFISLTRVLAQIPLLLKPGGFFLGLVKPQFELERSALDKNGIVRDSSLFERVESKIRSACAVQQMSVISYIQSRLEGTDGNREFFVLAKKMASNLE